MLYAPVKGSSAHIRFFFMTGISRFSKVSLFSDLNNLTDLSLEDDYHNMLGYTQEELENYFEPHIRSVAEKQGKSTEALLSDIREWYNGYSWNGEDRVYNPYSILRFFQNGKFLNFWFESGTPKFLIELLKKSMVYDVSETAVFPAEADNFDIDQMNLETLLFQTGYLTIREMDRFGRYVLTYPNKEVEESMTKYILSAYTHKSGSSSVAVNIAAAVQDHDMPLLRETVNRLFASIPHQIFDSKKEKYFHAVMFTALKLCGFFVRAEVSVAGGRVDAVMEYENRVYIFEFKLDGSAEAALKQIREKGYYKSFLEKGKSVFLIGISFSGESREIEEWETEEL
jgi:hypothetical protein